MRSALVSVLLLLAACGESFNDRTNRRLDTGTADVVALRAELAALKLQLAALPSATDLSPLAGKVAALEARADKIEAAMARITPAAELHLFADAEDLGPWTGNLSTFSPKYGAVVDWSPARIWGFASNDCTGEDVCIQTSGIPGTIAFANILGAVVLGNGKGMTCYSYDFGDGCHQSGGLSGPPGRALRDYITPPHPSRMLIRNQ